MKNVSIFFKICVAGCIIIIASILASCSTDPEVTPTATQTLSEKIWSVTYFFDTDKEETDDFAGYSFTFKSDGEAMATNSAGSTAGTWSIISDDGFRKFVLDFGLGRPLEELNDDWIIEEESATVLKLRDDNDTKVEELHFSAN